MFSESGDDSNARIYPKSHNGYLPVCKYCSTKTESDKMGGSRCGKCNDFEEDSIHHGGQNVKEDDDEIDTIQSNFPEGGWGWIVVVGSFCNSFIFDGIGSGYGVLYPYVHDKFHASAFVTSFAGSLFGAYLTMGSVAALLLKRFGFRAVSFAGGVMSCIAFALASQSSNVYLFLLSYGVMGSASIGLVYLPSMVIVNGYFNKKRGITNGIISSGSGMGLLVMAPVINALLDYYSLGGTVLILAGVLLNICVFSSCFRQPKLYNENINGSSRNQNKETVCLLNNENSSENYTEESAVDMVSAQPNDKERKDADICKLNDPNSNIVNPGVSRPETEMPYPALVITQSAECQMRKTNRGKFCALKSTDEFLCRELRTTQSHSASKLNIAKNVDNNLWMRSLNLLPAKTECNELETNTRKYPSQHSTGVFTDIGANSYLTGSISKLMHVHNQHFSSSNQLCPMSQQKCRSLSAIPTNNIVDGSVRHDSNIINSSSNEIKEEFSQDVKHFTKSELVDCSHNDLSNSVDTSCSIEIIPETHGYSLSQLFRMASFYLFCCGACLIQLGYPIPNIFLSDLAAAHGIPHHYGALMISLIGSFNIGGRLLGGALAHFNFNPIQVNDLAMFFAAVICFLCPLYTSVWSLCLFSAMYGFLLGFFPPLQPLIIVKYFGIGSLASTFGFVTSLKGIAGLIGPPLAGWIYDVTRDYSISIVFAGIAFLLSVVVNETLVYITRHNIR